MSEQRSSSLAGVRGVAAEEREPADLDDLDVALLTELSRDARASQRHLAAALGVSTPTVGERMAKLERAGVITGYAVQVDWAAVGYAETVYLSVTVANAADVASVMSDLWNIRAVEHVDLITGELDLLVRLRVRDYPHLRELLMDEVWQIAGLQGTSTLLSVASMPRKDFAEGLLAELRERAV